ncbi:hypothetical protein AB0L41_49140 [Amycolatopsis mediterranei]|uniref:hypothetical protein n=1 Tax=Amycolatopsis mediterranei TaxID=33910 RepID=UPI0034437917
MELIALLGGPSDQKRLHNPMTKACVQRGGLPGAPCCPADLADRQQVGGIPASPDDVDREWR